MSSPSPLLERCVHCSQDVPASLKSHHARTCAQKQPEQPAAEIAAWRGIVMPSEGTRPLGAPLTVQLPVAPTQPLTSDNKDRSEFKHIYGSDHAVPAPGSHDARTAYTQVGTTAAAVSHGVTTPGDPAQDRPVAATTVASNAILSCLLIADYEEQAMMMVNRGVKRHSRQHRAADIHTKGTVEYGTKPSVRAHAAIKRLYRAHADSKAKDVVEAQGLHQSHHVYIGSASAAIPLELLGQKSTVLNTFKDTPARLTEFVASLCPPNRRAPPCTDHLMVTPWKIMKISYESFETRRLEVDKLRITPDRYRSPRSDWVMFKESAGDEYHFGQLISVFTCTLDGVMFPLALIKVYDLVCAPRSSVDRDLGFAKIRARENEYSGSAFIHLGSIMRGALVIQDYDIPATYGYRGTSDHLVIDAVDPDMFLRLRDYFNWNA